MIRKVKSANSPNEVSGTNMQKYVIVQINGQKVILQLGTDYDNTLIPHEDKLKFKFHYRYFCIK